MLYENTGSYEIDMAAEIDSEEEILADEISARGNRITLKQAYYVKSLIETATVRQQARIVATVVDMVATSRNPSLACDCLSMAAGLDLGTGVKTQTDLAKAHGVTRALVSHYVVRFRDSLSGGVVTLDNFKFRKSNASREVFKKCATNTLKSHIAAAHQQHKQNEVK